MPWITVAGLGLCSIYFVYRNYVLRSLYPNLEDHSSGVDWYWPHVVHSVNEMIAIVLGAIAMITAGVTIVWRRMQRRRYRE